jgi:DNA-binding transcriptional MerR regulator
MARALTIGQVATATGVAAKTIRYYEEIGVLPTPSRTPSGYRQYDEPAVERLRFIGRARTLGLGLGDLKRLAVALNGRPGPALRPRLFALVREQLRAVEERIRDLQVLQQHLQHVAARLLTAPGRGETGPCRCLEPTGAAGPARRRGVPVAVKR